MGLQLTKEIYEKVTLYSYRLSIARLCTGTTYPAALVIPFKDAAAETKFYNDYADNNNWANANPQPTKKKFALDGIKQFMKEQSQNARQKVAQAAVVQPDLSDLP